MRKKVISVVLSIAMILGMTACGKDVPVQDTSENRTSEAVTTEAVSLPDMTEIVGDGSVIERTAFMNYISEEKYEIVKNPQAATYGVADDFSNVINKNDFEYLLKNSEAKEKLLQNGFVVLKGYDSEFFSLYEHNRYSFTPNFITADSMLHTYHLYFSHLMKNLERDYFYEDLKAVSAEMIETSLWQYGQLKGTEWEAAALRNAAFFSVGMKLLVKDYQVNPLVKEIVDQELVLIEAQNNIEISPVMAWNNSCDDLLKEDYTQYKVRGYYEEDETLSRYFQAMMWYGRLTFRLNSDEETKSAVLITKAMKNAEALTNWNRIYDVTSFFMGNSDDPGLYDYSPIVENIYSGETILSVAKDAKKWEALKAELSKIEPPLINSIPVYEYEDKDAVISGFRFIGQRTTFDATVFQQLIYDNVLENSNGGKRMLPSAMDIPAVLGSEAAEEILKESGAYDFEKYPENMEKMQKTVKGANDDVWKASLYSNWLNTLSPLLEEKGAGYPAFMQNDAWTKKSINTFLGSFTELKHDSVLYSKQVYAEMGGGDIDEPDYRGYVEPEAEVYARLAALSKLTKDGLSGYNMISQADADNLTRLQELAEKLVVISNKELMNEKLSEEEHDLIKSFGGQLEHFWYEALSDQAVDGYLSPDNHPSAVVTDIATDPNGSVLEIGTGAIDKIYVIVDVEGSLRIAEGGVYSFYEFVQPINERLTDKEWRVLLGIDFPENPDGTPNFSYSAESMEQPEWVKEFKVVE